MFRGMRKFVCDDCGHKFEGMDCEYQATAFSAPVKCPECGSASTMLLSGRELEIASMDVDIPDDAPAEQAEKAQ